MLLPVCLYGSLILAYFIGVCSAGVKSYEEILFPNHTVILSRGISCDSETERRFYPNQMYTCHNIRVDGRPLFHGQHMQEVTSEDNRPTNPCGEVLGQPNDVLALCRALLDSMPKAADKFHLIAAYIPNPICNQVTNEDRVKYFVDDIGQAQWIDTSSNNGFISMLQCLTNTKL